LLAPVARSQTAAEPVAPQLAAATPDTIHSTSTLVVVPTLVETTSGELVHNLQATDFLLTDNGVVQTVSIEQAERQPVAVVVLLQTGGAAPRQFQNYAGLGTMVDALTGSSPRQVAMVTFDSRPEEASDFLTDDDVNELKGELAHPAPGDGGAAILDAVNYGIRLLEKQPAGTRRVLLLLSQPQDDGSKAHADDVVRRLGETNTTIYSVTFSPQQQWLKDQFTHERHENGLYEFSPGIELLHTFNLSTPIEEALQAMRKDTAAEIATLSGGESVRFGDRSSLEQELSVLENHLPNRYTLTFRPSSSSPGFHAIKVQVVHQPVALKVSARESYWSSGGAQ
jgi:VWFA-related protein